MSSHTACAGPSNEADPATDARSRVLIAGLGLLLVAGILGIYWRVWGFPFVNFDDDKYVTLNEHVLGGLTSGGMRWALFSTEVSNWHPVTWWSHMLDQEIFGQDAGGHHATNVLWHALGTLLLFAFLIRATSSVRASFLVAAFFAWHPLRVESVAWVSERKDVLSGCFAFLALYLYAGYARRPSLLRYAGVFSALALGLMAKSMLVTLPFLFLLLDRWPLGRNASLRQRLLEKIPFLACSLLAAGATLFAQRSSGATASLGDVTFPIRLENSLASLAVYLRQTIWPVDLACLYPHPVSYAPDPFDALLPGAILGTALLLAGAAVATLLRRTYPMVWVGGLWTLGLLIPVIGLKQVGLQAHADRYTYLPMIGVSLAVVYGLAERASRGLVGALGSRVASRTAQAAASLALVGYAAAARQQVSVWESPDRIWERCLQVTEGNFTAHNNLGRLQATRGDLELAEEHFRAALAIRPGETPDPAAAGVHRNLGGVLRLSGRPREYIGELETAIRLNPEHLPYREELALTLAAWQQEERAIVHLEGALRLAPERRDLRNLLAEILAGSLDPRLRNGWRAMTLALELCESTGFRRPVFLATLAAAHAELGDFEAAVRRQTEALGRVGPVKRAAMRERLELYRKKKAWRRRP